VNPRHGRCISRKEFIGEAVTMFTISRRVAVPAAIFALAASTSAGVAVAASGAAPQALASTTACTPRSAPIVTMNRATWALVHGFVEGHYTGRARTRAWRRLTAHPAVARTLAIRLTARHGIAACATTRRQRRPVVTTSITPTTTTTTTPTPTAPAPPTTPTTSTPTTPITPTTITTPPVINATSPSGQAMPVGDLTGWHQVFADDFTKTVPLGSFGASNISGWQDTYPYNWPDTSGAGHYYPEKTISVHDGTMDLFPHTDPKLGPLVAAPVPTWSGGPDQTYGRYVIRFKTDNIPGYKTAWLLWPSDDVWPAHGEIDFPEGSLDGTIGGYVHYMNGTSGSDQYAMPDTGVKYSDGNWHTAQIDWLPTGVTFTLDGKVVGRTTQRVPSTPMHWVIQTETDNGTPPPSSAGHVYIDWATVYARA
jgi:hypothetical protein